MNKRTNTLYRIVLIIMRFWNYIIANIDVLRKRMLSFLVFVAISSAFWVYRSLDDIYVTRIKYPVKYINIPQNKLLAGNPPQAIHLKIKGRGYALMGNIINTPTLNLNVNDFSLFSQSKDSFRVYLVSRDAVNWLTNELNNESDGPLEIIAVEPDTISFSFTRSYAKKIAVMPRFADEKTLFARQHMLNGYIKTEPDSVTIIGPANNIDTIVYAYTKAIKLNNLNDSVTKKIDLETNKKYKYSASKVKVTIPVDRFTESTKDVAINVRNCPDSIRVKLFPGSVRLTYRVTLSMYNQVLESDFSPYVDYADINNLLQENNPKLKVQLGPTSDYVHSVNFFPQEVEFLIELKNDKSWLNRGNR
ncbi:MAG: YbbR-like domain-containing protein [Bacteroidales bacterium]|nr:YbbR-like domain-containing protein [Bacteroidales bacterium]